MKAAFLQLKLSGALALSGTVLSALTLSALTTILPLTVSAAGICNLAIPDSAVLLADQFPGESDKTYLSASNSILIDGVPNFRHAGDDLAFGMAQPTVEGLKKALTVIEQSATGEIMVVNLRQEAVVYINGIPYSYRDPSHLYNNLLFPGITTAALELAEECLVDRLKAEATAHQGSVMTAADAGGGVPKNVQIQAENIQTVKEVYAELNSDTHPISFHRVPMPDEQAPTPRELGSIAFDKYAVRANKKFGSRPGHELSGRARTYDHRSGRALYLGRDARGSRY